MIVTLTQAARMHLDTLREERRADRTQEHYGYVHDLYIRYLSERLHREPTLADLTLEHARAYLEWLRTTHRSPRWGGTTQGHSDSSIAYHGVVLRRWGVLIADMWEEKFPAGPPLQKLRVPRVVRKIPETLSVEQIELLVTLASTTQNRLRDQALILMLWDTGCRVSELCGLLVADLELATAATDGQVLVLGKGRKQRFVGFGLRCSRAIAAYLRSDERGPRDRQGKRPESPWLFLGHPGRQITPGAVLAMLATLRAKAGMQERLYPHKLRHSFGTQQAAAGLNAFQLQAQLGHATLAMTQRYVHLADTDLRRSYRSLADKSKPARPPSGASRSA